MSNVMKVEERQEKEKIKRALRNNLEEAAWLCQQYKGRTWFLEPPPRHDVPEKVRREEIKEMKEMLRHIPGVIMIPFTTKTEQEYRETLVDGLHIAPQHANATIKDIITRIGVNVTEKQETDVTMKERIKGNMCYKCGHGDFRKGHNCTQYHQCSKCLKKGHHPAACPSKVQMCILCGRRGHAATTCFRT